MSPLQPSALASLDFSAAVEAELGDPPRLLPSRTAESALSEHTDEYAQRLTALAQTGFPPAEQEIVWASKSRFGHRPLSVLPLRDRVFYRALVAGIEPHLSSYDRRRVHYDDFERTPLDLPDVAFVVSADVSAFYQYIDHSLLATRVVESAGRADLSRSLVDFLGSVFNRRFGIPQDNRASDVLGELYIAPIERSLIRSGLFVSRFNDDFRIATHSLAAGYESFERLQTELQGIGLTLNEEKSRVRRADFYRAGLGEVDRRTEAVLEAQQVDLTEFDSYTGEPIEPDPDEVAFAMLGARIGAGKSLFDEAIDRVFAGPLDAVDRLTNRQLLNRSLTILRAAGSSAVVGEGRRVLSHDPSLSPAYARYLQRLTANEATRDVAAAEALRLLSPGSYAPAWQRAWLLQTASYTQSFPT